MEPVLVTGAAGFIGYHLAARLIAAGRPVIGVDNLNTYYDPALKRARLAQLAARPGFSFVEADIADRSAMTRLFAEAGSRTIVHLAAQAGVRHGIGHPHDYADANLVGFLNVLEGARAVHARHLVFASTSSVYGLTPDQPFGEGQETDHPASLYAATKKANEMMAHSYAHLFALPVTGLRFFTVYGPWGRPDMAIYSFTRAAFEGRTVDLYNHGQQKRDFTYVDDIVSGITGVIDRPPAPDPAYDAGQPHPARSSAPYRLFNIGNNRPETLATLVALIEKHTGKPLDTRLIPAQPGDVVETYANIDALSAVAGYRPTTTLDEGIGRFVAWYRGYHHV